jgi:Protein of unknown function (DUF2971)
MMLYKYLSFTAGRATLRNSQVCFMQPKYFNDPFDKPRYPREPGANSPSDLFGPMRVLGKEFIWGENTGILSLTRTPTNPLMWAHYAEMHKGIVIGIDTIAAGFTKEESNLIPAQYGSVIYVSRRPMQQFISKAQAPLAVGATHHFPSDHYEKLQRIFLHKPICWSYEEEVRVLKCLNGLSESGGVTESGEFKIVSTGDRVLHLFSLPKKAIKEVYFGLRTDNDASDNLYYEIKELLPDLSVFECQLDDSALTVGYVPYTTVAEAVG